MGNGNGFRRQNGNGDSAKPRMPENPQPHMVQIQLPDVATLTSYHCPDCMNNVFGQAFRIWEISALISPTGIAQPANQQVWRCLGCGLAWDQGQLKKLNPQEREALISEIKAKRGEAEDVQDLAVIAERRDGPKESFEEFKQSVLGG